MNPRILSKLQRSALEAICPHEYLLSRIIPREAALLMLTLRRDEVLVLPLKRSTILLSKRPDGSAGLLAMWDKATQHLFTDEEMRCELGTFARDALHALTKNLKGQAFMQATIVYLLICIALMLFPPINRFALLGLEVLIYLPLVGRVLAGPLFKRARRREDKKIEGLVQLCTLLHL